MKLYLPRICGVIGILLAGAVTVAGAADWVTFNGDPAATGVSAEKVEPPLELVWEFSASGGFYTTPAVVGGRVYAGCQDWNVYALDAETGEPVWIQHTGGKVYSGATVVNGTVYIGSSDRNIYALDAQTGQVRWKYPLEGVIYGTPLVHEGVVCIGPGEGSTLHGIDAQTGKRLWLFQMGQRVGSALSAGEGSIFVGSYDQNLYALDPRTGAMEWQFQAPVGLDSCPTVAEGTVFLKTGDDVVYALNAQTGRMKWRRDPVVPNTAPNWSPLSVAQGLLYFGSGNGHVYALDTRTGEDVWCFPPPRFEAQQTFASCPSLSGGVAYVNAKDGTLYALEARTGELLWRRLPQQPAGEGLLSGVMWPPAVSHGKVFVASLAGTVSAYQSAAGGLPGEIVRTGRPEEEGTGEKEEEKEAAEDMNIFGELDQHD